MYTAFRPFDTCFGSLRMRPQNRLRPIPEGVARELGRHLLRQSFGLGLRLARASWPSAPAGQRSLSLRFNAQAFAAFRAGFLPGDAPSIRALLTVGEPIRISNRTKAPIGRRARSVLRHHLG